MNESIFESLGSFETVHQQLHPFCLPKSPCSASSNLEIHKVFLRFSSLIRTIYPAHNWMFLLLHSFWVFPSTIIYCSFTQYFTISHLLALCSVFKVHCEHFVLAVGNFELVFDFSSAALCFCMRKEENRKTTEIWWAQVDSNHRPHAYQACALTC